MRVFVTGGAGFIGSSLVDAYLELGHEVFAFDNLHTGKEKNVHHDAKFILGDILDDALFDAVRAVKPHVISHHAGLAGIEGSYEDPVGYGAANFHGTTRVLLAALESGVRRVIYGSSSTPLYGKGDVKKMDEYQPLSPLNPYGVYSASSELMLKTGRREGIDTVCLRYSNVYGPRQDPLVGGVIATFVDRILKEQLIEIHGDGTQRRDFVFIDDVAHANVAALDFGEGESFHVCSGVETEIRVLPGILHSLSGKKVEIFQDRSRDELPVSSYLDNRKAWDLLGWTPSVGIEDGIHRVWKYRLEEEGDN